MRKKTDIDTGKRSPDSMLFADTETMYRTLRAREKELYRRRLGIRVAEPAHASKQQAAGNELDNSHQPIKEQPWLKSQRFDGAPPTMSAVPELNDEARTNYDNAKREQDLDYKLRNGLVNAPKFNPRPGDR